MPRPLSRTHDAAVGVQLELDAAGVAGHRLVHGVVEHLGDQVVQRALVGAADIHAGPAAHRLQPLQDLDVLGGIAGARLAGEIVVKRSGIGATIRNGAGQSSYIRW